MRWLGACVVVVALASPAWAIYQSTFDEPLYTMNEYLDGQDNWTAGGSGNSSIWVDLWDGSGTVQINPYLTSTQDVFHDLDAENPTQQATVDIDILPGIGTPGNCWYIWVEDASGNPASYWYGGINTAQARVGSSVTAITGGITTRTTLRAVIDVELGATDYYYDKHDGAGMTYLTSKSGYTASSIDVIHIQSYGRGWDDTWAFFDNLNIPEPTTVLLLGLGGLLGLRRRRA